MRFGGLSRRLAPGIIRVEVLSSETPPTFGKWNRRVNVGLRVNLTLVCSRTDLLPDTPTGQTCERSVPKTLPPAASSASCQGGVCRPPAEEEPWVEGVEWTVWGPKVAGGPAVRTG